MNELAKTLGLLLGIIIGYSVAIFFSFILPAFIVILLYKTFM